MNKSIILITLVGLGQYLVFSKTIRQERRFEIEECEELIPKFINHISENTNVEECGKVGQFPMPGECNVFFKCIRGHGKIQRFLEYCAVGYNFNLNSCVPSKSPNDCPQFPCRLLSQSSPDDTGIEPNNNLTNSINQSNHTLTSDQEKFRPKYETTITAAQKAEGSQNNNSENSKNIEPILFLLMIGINKFVQLLIDL